VGFGQSIAHNNFNLSIEILHVLLENFLFLPALNTFNVMMRMPGKFISEFAITSMSHSHQVVFDEELQGPVNSWFGQPWGKYLDPGINIRSKQMTTLSDEDVQYSEPLRGHSETLFADLLG
jgi:hypothetical protein